MILTYIDGDGDDGDNDDVKLVNVGSSVHSAALGGALNTLKKIVCQKLCHWLIPRGQN